MDERLSDPDSPELCIAPAAGQARHASDIRRQLGRIVHSAAFRNALRLVHFISFVVETTLAGHGRRIKAYTIAVEALGREPSFDPQADPIVRVEAGRLRQALARYYAGEGHDDPLVIELPRGTYVPVFHWRDGDRPRAVPEASALARPAVATAPWPDLVAFQRECETLRQIVRAQFRALAEEIQTARRALHRSQKPLRGQSPAGLACRPALSLVPTAPSATNDAARPADGPEVRQKRKVRAVEQA
jgi:hypothetical protein